ncbi:MAG: di-trans,poly-cis-decaprenylcistransferase [Alphaproteobacteria bacterium]|nr:di-trans,poly-cis-decaprenylcistransferase [Alphaproteobacteria bacterium]
MKKEQTIPAHVAVIMDGNGRWAKKRALPRTAGHREGVKVVEKLADTCLSAGVRYLTLFCFSSENWNRPKTEVNALFSLLENYLRKEIKPFRDKGINISFLGHTELLPEKIRELMSKTVSGNLPPEQEKLRLILAISYGGREEIADTARRLAQMAVNQKIKPEEINEKAFASAMYMPDIPDPDLVIRTSGEKRISNFLLWQSAYSEYVFLDTLWPDCTEKDFTAALDEYAARHRRFGKVK